MPKTLNTEFQKLFNEANQKGLEAANKTTPVPMHLVGSTPGGITERYTVNDGPCGFAWVSIRPGNCPFANWLKKNDLGSKDSYAGGVMIWIHEHRQSLTLKEVHAQAMAQHLRENGINATSNSRID